MADPRGAPAPQSPLRQLWQSKKRRKRRRAQTQWARMYATQTGGRRSERRGEKGNIAVPCVSFCHLLWLSPPFSPLLLRFVPHQRLPPWQTSSRGCFFDSQCRPLHRRLPAFRRALFICGAAHAHRKASHLLLPSLKAKLAIRGGFVCHIITLQHVDKVLIKFILTLKSFVSVNLHSLKQRA